MNKMKVLEELKLKDNSVLKSFTKDKILLIAIAGIILIISSYLDVKKDEDNTKQDENLSVNITEYDYVADLENRLEDIIKSIHGTGDCKVMITLKSSEEKVLQKDTVNSNTQETNDTGSSKSTNLTENTLVLKGDEEAPYVTKEIMPKVEGVVVVTKGANDSVVCQTIIKLVQALFDVEMHKISIVEMK